MTPDGWRALRLGDAISFEYGRSLPSSQRRGGSVPVCGSNGIVGYHDESLVRGPGIVVGRKGSVGAVAWMDCDFWPIDTTYYVHPTSHTDVRWLYYALSNLELAKLNEATGTPGLNRSTATSLRFQLPPIFEQRKIAGILTSVDETIEATEAIIDQTRRVKKGLMQELFTRGLPGRHSRSKPLPHWRLGRVAPSLTKIPESWNLVPILSVAKLESGHTPSRRKPEYWNGSVPWISLHDTGSLDEPEIANTEQSISELGLRHSSARLLPKGTVVFSRTATIGKSTIMARSMCTTQDFANYVCGPRLHNRYLMQLFRHMQPEWKRLMAGSTHKTVYMPIFRQLQILLPPLAEQTEIADILECLDNRIVAETEHQAELRNLKDGLMSVLLTGELRVTPEPE